MSEPEIHKIGGANKQSANHVLMIQNVANSAWTGAKLRAFAKRSLVP
jgi:hypothetical protein